MSLIICVHVEEGIVLAGDSRSSYNKTDGNITQVGVHTTNTTNKVFSCPNKVGIAVCGDASVKGIPISGFVESFIREKIKEETDVEEMPNLVKTYFKNLDQNLNTTFVIAGYKKQNEKYIPKIFRVRTNMEGIETIDTEHHGALWDGETATLTKLIQPVYIKDGDNFILLPVPEIAWNLYTLQDAIDFSKYGIKTTIDAMRFQTMPETVGGPIDILIMKPDKTEWLVKKELKG